MSDRGRYWPGRRVLVLGCTGFLGGWAVRGLLARGAEVVGLVRGVNPDVDFFRDKLYQHAHVVRGRADDVPRLRSLLAVYETQLVVQCAADPDGSADSYNRAAITAAGLIPVVVPVPPGLGVVPRLTTDPHRRQSDVTFVRVPILFGAGDRRWDRWPARLLWSAARGEPLPPPPAAATSMPVSSVRDAAEAMLDVIADAPAADQPGYRVTDVQPSGTAAELFAVTAHLSSVGPRLLNAPDLRSPMAEAVAGAIDWYRSAVPPGDRPGVRPPVPKAA